MDTSYHIQPSLFDSDDTPKRQCAICEEWFPETEDYFSPSPRGKGGLRIQCRKCANATRRAQNAERKLHPKEVLPEGDKRCPECTEVKLANTDNFFETRKNSGKFRRRCKDCINKQCKEYVETHQEEHRAATQNWYYAHIDENRAKGRIYCRTHRDKGRVRSRRYRICHRERINERQRARNKMFPEAQQGYSRTYRQKHPERVKQASRNTRIKHRERANVNKRNYYARKGLAQGSHTVQDILNQYERQKGRCYWCDCKLGKHKHEYHVDHIVPLSRGGSNGPDNLVIACPHCNMSRHNKLPHEWFIGGKLL